MTQFHVTPERYLDLLRRAIPAYDELQEAIGRATDGVDALRVLDLGTESRSAYRMGVARSGRDRRRPAASYHALKSWFGTSSRSRASFARSMWR
jgi:hypothetical protein